MEYRCNQCGHVWEARIDRKPHQCPRCKRYDYAEENKSKEKNETEEVKETDDEKVDEPIKQTKPIKPKTIFQMLNRR